MRAAYYEGHGGIRVADCVPVTPGPGQVQLRVANCGICGNGLHIYHGNMGHRVKMPQVIVPGHDLNKCRHWRVAYAIKVPAATEPASWFVPRSSRSIYTHFMIECRGDSIRESGAFLVYNTIDDPSIVVPGLSINGVRNQDKDKGGLPDEGEHTTKT